MTLVLNHGCMPRQHISSALRPWHVCLASLVLVLACKDTKPGVLEFAQPGSTSAASGKGSFVFGAATAATQIEDLNPNVDWYVWTAPAPEGQGKGTFVVDRRGAVANNPFANIISSGRSSVDELLEFRIGLGTHGVTLAAERATDSDIKFLESVMERSCKSGLSAQEETEADIAFHMGIAYATHNIVYVDLTRQFYEYMFYRLKELHSILYTVKANLEQIEQQHAAILAGIKAHDPDAARASILYHIQFLRDVLRGQTTV